MAEKIERTYTVPLRREYLKVPNYRRTEKASRALREFLVKHMKSDTIKVGKFLNEHIWMHGMKNPPHHVKVNAVKVPEGIVYAELFGKPLKIGKEKAEKKEEKKAEEKKSVENVVEAEVVKEEKVEKKAETKAKKE
jgi:large subunit ribosomal protein L31e